MNKSMSGTKDPSKQEDDSVPDDDTAIHERICSSLVSIIGYKPAVEPREIESVITGVIIASGDSFCHIVALWIRVLNGDKLSNWMFEVIFQDGTRMDLPRQDVNIKGGLAAFTLRPPTKFNPVKISAHKVSRNDQVFAVGFGYVLPPNKALQFVVSHRSRGFVTNAGVAWFCHDCTPRYETYEGDPIFDKQDEFVGITVKDRGIAVACSISYIAKLLAQFHNGMVDRPLSEILQCIMDKEEPPKEKETLTAESKEAKKQRVK
ncbi:hypothetical protein GQ55_2G289900 [Panicum hallii var. hallii]|uniref:Uncharacterized protein n=1 Tax=Panicum hallii var. hallii TaxID=1504633 RepID=A0A2T7ETI1_9POAL|nr:hypothetical protein GQ55_2G289900 [Panicum hallii var. hallii]PUZ71133.1 hypothetical protein GQ55_2G289900 [Panicum hallii var. hallii]PUZ71134.1 hypothetical protein GQ55_2G289900 [Panicum hallii var. hallii]